MCVTSEFTESEILDAVKILAEADCVYDHIKEAEKLYVVLHSPRYMGQYFDTDSVKGDNQ